MNTNVNLWQYLGEFFSQYEFMRTNGEEKSKHNFMFNIVFRKSLLLWDHETRHEETGRAIADNVAHAYCMATNTHSEYITAPRLDEGVAMLIFLLFVIIAIWRENM